MLRTARAVALVAVFAVALTACKASGEIRPPFITERGLPKGALSGVLLATSQLPGGAADLLAVDLSGSTVLGTVGGAPSHSPSFSPDHQMVAFARNDLGDGKGGILVMAPGQAPQRVVQGGGLYDHPSWSPDGSQIVYAHNDSVSSSWHLFAVDVATRHIRTLTQGPHQDWYPAWSPTGSQIAFTSDRDGDNAVWMLDVSNGAMRKIVDSAGEDEQPAWSPDGSKLVYTSSREMHQWQLFIMDMTSMTEHGLVRSETMDRYPTYSPDGRYVMVSTGYLAVYRADGGNLPGGGQRWRVSKDLALSSTWAPSDSPFAQAGTATPIGATPTVPTGNAASPTTTAPSDGFSPAPPDTTNGVGTELTPPPSTP